MKMDALNFRLGDIPRSAALLMQAKGGMGNLGDVDFGAAWDSYGATVDYGGVTYDEAASFMPYDETEYLADGMTDWEPFYDFGGEIPPADGSVPWPEADPVWNWGSPTFNPDDTPPIRGEGGTVTSEGVDSDAWSGGGLSLPSMQEWTRLITAAGQVGTQVYTAVQQAEINEQLAERGIIPGMRYPTGYQQTMLPGVPRTTTGTPRMVWNPATNRYEAVQSSPATQLIPGIDNTMLIAGAAGIAALLLLGGKKGRR